MTNVWVCALVISIEYAETCSTTSGVLESVKTLKVHHNTYTDTGIAYIVQSSYIPIAL